MSETVLFLWRSCFHFKSCLSQVTNKYLPAALPEVVASRATQSLFYLRRIWDISDFWMKFCYCCSRPITTAQGLCGGPGVKIGHVTYSVQERPFRMHTVTKDAVVKRSIVTCFFCHSCVVWLAWERLSCDMCPVSKALSLFIKILYSPRDDTHWKL